MIDLKEQLNAIALEAKAAVEAASSNADLEALRVKYLGKKGEVTAILKQMGKLSAEERPVVGQLANEVRADIEAKLDARRESAAAEALQKKENPEYQSLEFVLDKAGINMDAVKRMGEAIKEAAEA